MKRITALLITVLAMCGCSTFKPSSDDTGEVTYHPTDELIVIEKNLQMRANGILATCLVSNTTDHAIGDAMYSAQFYGTDKKYYGTTLSSVNHYNPETDGFDTIKGHATISLEISMYNPATAVDDLSYVMLELEFGLPEKNASK